MAIHRFTVDYSTLIDPGSVCTNYTVAYGNPQNVTIPCEGDNSIDIQINTDVPGPYCVDFIVDCTNSCQSCGQILVTKCFCIDSDDCGDCESCNTTTNICVSTCAAGKICDNDSCVDCTNSDQCLCNQVCTQGVCHCPAGLKQRADGCCVECFDGEDLGNCLICEGGIIKAVDCPGGYCNHNTGDCQECLNNEHCTEPNECCNENGICECCPGYVRDPETNQCIEAPPCTDAQYCIDHFGKCYYCTEDGCAPIICPDGFTCDPTTGDCVPECGNCPEGQGCINGMCKPCSELSCSGEGLLCQYAVGCQCVSGNCEWIDCSPENVELTWVRTPSQPGQQLIPGLPALQGTTNIVALSMVYNQAPLGSGYYNHQFNLALTNATNGNWTLYNTPTETMSLGGGTSKSFDLTSTGPNLIGFIVKFVETGTGRTATWEIFRTPTAPLDQPNVWNSTFASTGTAGTTTGGTPGSVKLCSTNGNFTPTGVTNVQTTNDLVINFISDGQGCLTASVTGCGTWNGDVVLTCGGNTITVPAPEFSIDPANCCNPTDPNCDGVSTGSPCGDLTVQNITLVALPTFGSNADGDGEFLIVADWTTAGLSFSDLFYLNPADGCWSTANNPAASSNDVQIVTGAGQSPLGPSVSNLAVVATLGDGGCIRLGHTCELRISGCRKLQGEICMTECSAFEVKIVANGGDSYSVISSLADEAISYQWVASQGTLSNPTGTTTDWDAPGGSHTICVTGSYGFPVIKCVEEDCLGASITRAGCKNPAACNYDPNATQDDNSCIVVLPGTYECALGGFQLGLVTSLLEGSPGVVYKIGSTVITTNSVIEPGDYTVDVYINGLQKCSFALNVPQCYRCNTTGDCIPAPDGANTGLYTEADCGGACSCNIEINITQNCANNRGSLTITATGDTGEYNVSVEEVGGPQVLAPTFMTDTGLVITPLLCNGKYRITVAGKNCTESVTYFVTCWNCGASDLDLENVSYDCPTNQLFFTIQGDPCSDTYTVRLLDSSLALVPGSQQSYISDGPKTLPLGIYPGDGVYTLELRDNNVCVRNATLELNCNGTLSPCPITALGSTYTDDGFNISFSATFTLSEAGGSYVVRLQDTTGGSPTGCGAAVPNNVIASQNVVGVVGANTVNFPDAVPTPGTGVCYAITVQRLGTGYGSCNETDLIHVIPTAPPVSCEMELSNVSYDTETGMPLVSWNGTNTGNDVTIQLAVSPDATCHVGDPVEVSVSGNGEDGNNVPFGPVHQIQGQAQCITASAFDTANPSCIDSLEFTIPACACAIVIDEGSVFVDSANETLEVTFSVTCSSGNINVDFSGDAAGSASVNTGSENGTTSTHTVILALTGYSSTGGSGVLEITDDADGTCIDTLTVTLPANCVSCGQHATLFIASGSTGNDNGADVDITEIVEYLGANILSAPPISLPTEEESGETEIENDITVAGGNFCAEGTPVDISPIRVCGIEVNQDTDLRVNLNYATITSAEFGGTRRVYFSKSCFSGHTCDYSGSITVPGATTIWISLACPNCSGYTTFTGQAFNATPTPTQMAAFKASIESLLNAMGYAHGGVTVSFAAGSLTVAFADTNAGIGLLYIPGGDVVEFTQAGCV